MIITPFDRSKTAEMNRHLVPKIYRELKAFRYGKQDVKNFFSSQQGRFLANKIAAIYRDSILPLKEKEKNIMRIVRNTYVNYRIGQRSLSI